MFETVTFLFNSMHYMMAKSCNVFLKIALQIVEFIKLHNSWDSCFESKFDVVVIA